VDAATNEVLDLEQRFAQYVNNAFAHITTVYVYWKGDGTSDGPANVEISTRFGPDGAAPAGSSHESRTIKNKWDSELKIDSAYRNLKADIEAWEKRPALK
jgi:hypothetical protein